MDKNEENKTILFKKLFDELSLPFLVLDKELSKVLYFNKSAEKFFDKIDLLLKEIKNKEFEKYKTNGNEFYIKIKLFFNNKDLLIELKSYEYFEEVYVIMLINEEFSYLENQIFLRLHEAIIKTDNFGKVKFANQEAYRVLELNEEVIGKNIKEIFYVVDSTTGKYIGELVKVYKEGEIVKFPFNTVLITKTGNEFLISGEAIPVITNDNVEGMFLFFKDRTPEKQYLDTILYQQQFSETIINNLHDGLVVLNEKFEIIKGNKAFFNFIDSSEEEIIGKKIFDLKNVTFDRKELYDILSFIQKNEKYISDIELKLEIKEKGEFVVLINGNKILGNTKSYVLIVLRDITLQKKLQKQLEEDEEKFRTLANSASVAIFIYDSEKFLYLNKYIEELTGYKIEELIGTNFLKVVHPDFHEMIRGRAEARLRGENIPTRYEFKIVTKDGHEKWIDFTAGRITYKGRPAGIGTAYDITDLKKAYERLEQLNTTLKVIRNVNQLITRVHDRDELLKQTCDLLIENNNFLCACIVLVSEDKIKAEDFYFSFCEKFKNTERQDLLCLIKDKKEIPICIKKILEDDILMCLDDNFICKDCGLCINNFDKIFGIRLSFKNKIYGVLLIHTKKNYFVDSEEELLIKEVAGDISYAIYNIETEQEKTRIQKDLEESELKYKNLFNNNHTIMLIINPEDGKIIDVNPAAINYYGYPEEQFNNMYISDINILPIEKLKEEMQKAKEKKKNHFVFKHKKANGEIRDVEVYSNPVTIKGKTYLFSIIHDITEKVKKEEELKIAMAKAEESDKMKTIFLRNVSHEIRTPMNAILGFANLLKLKPTSEKIDYYVDIINNNALQLLNIIDDIITLSKFESEQKKLNIERFSISKFLNELIAINQEQSINKNIKIILNESKNIEEDFISADKIKITQILNNFISNALKYTPEGTIEVGYNVENKKIVIYVKDTGVGIKEDEKKHIFKPFFRGEYAQQKAIRGTGIGLSISKKLAESMGGRVYFESEYLKGTTFYLEVPVTSNDKVKKDDFDNKIDKIEKTVHKRKLNIIILEDEFYNYLYLETVLKAEGHNISWAKNYEEFKELIKKGSYDLLLLDLKVPGLSGVKLLEEIRKEYKELPIIVQSAYVEDEIVKQVQKAGCNEYIKKPISRKNLLSIINKLYKNLI